VSGVAPLTTDDSEPERGETILNSEQHDPDRRLNSEYVDRKPTFKMPAGACDAHVHIFGPANRFPYVTSARYSPKDVPKEDLAALHRDLGIDRSVLVQPTCHGTDNRAMLEALAWGKGCYRGVALLSGDERDAELADMAAAGVRGVRLNFLRHLGGAPDLTIARQVVSRAGELGWHVQLHFDASGLIEFDDFIRSIEIPIVIDHMGRTPVADGIDQPSFKALLKLQERPNCWVKVSGADRITARGSPYHDAVPFARAVVERAPERVVWGTDFPHPMLKMPQDNVALVDLVPLIAPDPLVRQKLLVDNPARLYEFE
jgi:predicted TIM-barrel fold metal-dependent hydrolase